MELQDAGRPGWHVGEYRGADTVSQLAFSGTAWKDAPAPFGRSALAIECGLSRIGQSEILLPFVLTWRYTRIANNFQKTMMLLDGNIPLSPFEHYY